MDISDLTLRELRDAGERAIVVAAAVEVGLFRALGRGAATANDLADGLGLDGRAVAIVLGALESTGFVVRADGAYDLTDRARQLADPDDPDYAGGSLGHWLDLMQAFVELPEALRHGGPVGDRPPGERSEEDVARFMHAMASRDDEQVRRTVELVLARQPGAKRVLDIGGGPGVYARELLAAGVESVTLLDRRDTLRYVADAYDLGRVEGLELVPGDFRDDPLPGGPFDVVLLGNVMHIYDRVTNAALLRKVHDVVAWGGAVAIADFVRGRSVRAERFAVVMLLRSDGGNAYDEATYRGWLDAAGFVDVGVDDVTDATQLVTAVRPA